MAPPKGGQRKKAQRPAVKAHHGFLALIILCGWLVPPLAVVIRFGIGLDFFLNIFLTCMGYFPGHIHNYFIQNIRNNRNRGRTPRWALKAGLVEDDTAYLKSTRQWGNRYDERNARNVYDDEHAPEEDEWGNAVERGIVEHGRHPAQPAGGFGDNGNETAMHRGQGDLLAGLPDEEREQRRKARKNQKQEYGSGFDDEYTQREEATSRRQQNNSLLHDLDDPDAAMYGSSRGGQNKPLKSARQSKADRYGLASDHKDLNGGSISSRSRNGRSKQPSSGSDRYDVVDDERSNGRRRGGEDDFLNHQF